MAENSCPTMPTFKRASLVHAALQSFLVFLIGAVCTFLLAQVPAFSSSNVVIPIGLVLSFALFASSTVLLWARTLNNCLTSNGNILLRWLAAHQAYLIEVWAAKTPPHLIEALHHMPVDHRKWIIAKFMSKAIDGAFSESGNRIEIPDISKGQYSEILSSLIAECRHEIRMSCPWTPTEWFESISPPFCDPDCDGRPCTLPNRHLSTIRFHDHIHTLIGNHRVPRDSRVRLLILKKSLESMTADKCYTAFCNLARYACLQQYYIDLGAVESSEQDAVWLDRKKKIFKDVNILDGIVVYWEPKSQTSDMGKCVMLLSGEEYEAVIRLLSSRTYLRYSLSVPTDGAPAVQIKTVQKEATEDQPTNHEMAPPNVKKEPASPNQHATRGNGTNGEEKPDLKGTE